MVMAVVMTSARVIVATVVMSPVIMTVPMVIVMAMLFLGFGWHRRRLKGAFGRPVNLAQRDSALSGQPRAVFKFRREDRFRALPPAELSADRPPSRLDRVLATRTLRALDDRLADAERGRLVEQNRFELFDIAGSRQHA